MFGRTPSALALAALAAISFGEARAVADPPPAAFPREVVRHHLTPGAGHDQVAVDSSGRILAASGSTTGLLVTRYLADGAVDKGFGEDGTAELGLERFVRPAEDGEEVGGSGTAQATALAVAPDGEILVAGTLDTDVGFAGGDVSVIGRLHRGGTIDRSFGGGAVDGSFAGRRKLTMTVASILPERERVILAGMANRAMLLALRSDGTHDPGFGSEDRPGKIALQLPPPERKGAFATTGIVGALAGPGGGFLLAGFDTGAMLLAAATAAGHPDRTFAGGGTVEVNPARERGCGCFRGGALARDARGRLLVAGSLRSLDGTASTRPAVVARFLPGGELDRSFGDRGFVRIAASPSTEASDLVVDHRGRVVVVGPSGTGSFPQFPGFTVTRLLPDGRRDPTFFDHGVFRSRFGTRDAIASSVAVERAGGLVIGGRIDLGIEHGRLLEHGLLVRVH